MVFMEEHGADAEPLQDGALSRRLLTLAAVYFAMGVMLGIYAGITHDHRFTHVHVHLSVLGWMSLGLIAVIYRIYPQLADGWPAQAHFWMHNIGLPMFMAGIGLAIVQGPASSPNMLFVPLIGLGSTLVAIAALAFLYNVVRTMHGSVRTAH
jgi:hypothetical protein